MTREDRRVRDLSERLQDIETVVILNYPPDWAYDGGNLPLMITNIVRYYQRRLDAARQALEPFADMDRPNEDLNEIACQRGIASDATYIQSKHFRRAREVVEDIL